MAKITPVLWKHKTNKKGRSPIYLRIADGSKNRYVSLRVYILPSQWNERTGRVRKSHTQSEAINAMIAERVSEAESEILRLQTDRASISADQLKENLALPANGRDDFFAFADEVIADFERRGKIHSHVRFKAILGKFRAFAGVPLPYDRLTPALLRKYETHLIQHHDNSTNTVASNLKAIRTVLYRAIREGHFPQEKNPFFQFKIKQGRPSRGKLSLPELRTIEALDLPEGTLIWHVRNYFLFSFYCAGIRFGDMAQLRPENIVENGEGPRLEYSMSKTGGRKSIKLLPEARSIVDHYRADGEARTYLFPMLEGYDLSTPRKLYNAIASQNALVNKYLKKVAKRAEITCNLSFHISRHSFADIARQKGWDVYLISKALGHSSIKVTENYLKGFDAEALDAEMENLFGGEQ